LRNPAPVDGLSHYLKGFNQPFGGAGLRWPIHSYGHKMAMTQENWGFNHSMAMETQGQVTGSMDDGSVLWMAARVGFPCDPQLLSPM